METTGRFTDILLCHERCETYSRCSFMIVIMYSILQIASSFYSYTFEDDVYEDLLILPLQSETWSLMILDA